jgi:hypothetical protein
MMFVNRRIALLVLLTSFACSISAQQQAQAADRPKHVTIEPIAMRFKEGCSGSESDLEGALDPGFSRWALDSNLRMIRNNKGLVFDVAGYADRHECSGVRCMRLSVDRAMHVYTWLIANGVDPGALRSVAGYGDSVPVDPGTSEKSKSINRRVELILVWPKT